MKNKLNYSALRWLAEVTGKKKIYIFLLLLIQTVLGISGVLYALFLRNIIDSAAAGDRIGFTSGIISVVLLVLLQIILRAAARHTEELSRSEYENQLKKRLFGTLLAKNFERTDSVHSGEWINRLTNDTVVCAGAMTEILPGITGMTVKLAAAVIMLLAIEPKFAFILVPGGILMLVITYSFRKILKGLHKNIQEKDGRLRMYFQDITGSMLVVRSFAAEEKAAQDAGVLMSEHRDARMKRNRFANICNTGFAGVMNAMYILGVCYGSSGIMKGTLTYGTLTALLQLIAQIQSPFANITAYLPKFFAMTASAERIMEAEKFEDSCSGKMHSLSEASDFYRNRLRMIKFENVFYTYLPPAADSDEQKMPVVLENVNLEIKKGEYTALTGHSGCGKSTLLKLMMSLYRPESGEIKLESDTEEILSPEWRRLFAYVPQGSHIMSGTVREIVSFPDPSDSGNDRRIKNALSIACADFIYETENGTETVLGERGQGLSEGQIQRLSIARAVYSDCPFLLLDEATSALDEETEARVLANLRNMTDKTVVIVTHRPAALDICDSIYEFTGEGIVRKK